MHYKTYYQSPIGRLLILADDQALLGVWFEGQKYFGAAYDLEAIPVQKNDIIREVIDWLDRYFQGENPPVEAIPLEPEATDFRKKVWDILLDVPYGQTSTYADILTKLRDKYGEIGSARAVGGAIGHNPISILIPCHRILGSQGQLTGYAGGLDKKRFLLQLEGIAAEEG